MYKLIFFVPETHVESVKDAVFQAGAGKQGHYDQCAWQTLGQGQFRPLKGAQPHIGSVDQLETVAEWRVEVLLTKEKLASVLKALKAAHPYEHPAFDVVQLVSW
jgi:structural hemagglutinin/hemolysin toxin protein RtxA